MAGVFDYQVLAYWFIISGVIGMLVALLYRLVNGQDRKSASLFRAPVRQYLLITSPEAESRIESARRSLAAGETQAATAESYSAVEFLLLEGCARLGVDPLHITLEELCTRLASARLAGLDCAQLQYLEEAARPKAAPPGPADAERCLAIAESMRRHLARAPMVAGPAPSGQFAESAGS